MTFSGLSAGGAKAPRSPLCLCKGIHRLYDGAEDGQNGKLCNPFTGLNLIGLVELVDQLRTPRRYNRCQSRNAVGKRNSVLDAEPAASKYEASRPFWQFNGNAGGNHRMAPRWKQQGSVDAGAEIQPALPGVARWGRIAFSRIFLFSRLS